EHVLFAGQTVDFNQYIHSKFMAERFIYEEILTHGLNAKVFRVGNLAPRLSDGKFQVNFRTNNIMNTLRAYKVLGMVSFSELANEIEFSPIDCLAKAVVTLARTPRECVCFIPLNPHRALMQDVFTEIRGLGCEIRTAEDDELKQALDAALSDSRKNSAVAPLVAYSNNNGIQELGYESLNTGFTQQVLYRLGFSWPETGSEYIGQFIRKLDGLSFFDE
ncbi:MAG: SDR family oxidoreductase, partial [Synergistaceae bacterium]|nr:SDR family oxidoreductase [Synergistaceae bacterium]